MRPEIVWRNEQKIAFFEAEFGIADFPLQHLGTNRTFINIEEGDVVVGNFVKKDDELHEVGIRLLPEGLFAAPKQVVDE